jgi:hypothetical protein
MRAVFVSGHSLETGIRVLRKDGRSCWIFIGRDSVKRIKFLIGVSRPSAAGRPQRQQHGLIRKLKMPGGSGSDTYIGCMGGIREGFTGAWV